MTFRVADPENPFRDVMLEARPSGLRAGSVAKAMKAKRTPVRTDKGLDKHRKRAKTVKYGFAAKNGSSKARAGHDDDDDDDASETPLQVSSSLAAQSEDIGSSFDSPSRTIALSSHNLALPSRSVDPAAPAYIAPKRSGNHKRSVASDLRPATSSRSKIVASSTSLASDATEPQKVPSTALRRSSRAVEPPIHAEQHEARVNATSKPFEADQITGDALREELRSKLASNLPQAKPVARELPPPPSASPQKSRASQVVVSVWKPASPQLRKPGTTTTEQSFTDLPQASQGTEEKLKSVLASAGCEDRGESWQRVPELGGRTVSACSRERMFRSKAGPPSRHQVQFWFKQLEGAKA